MSVIPYLTFRGNCREAMSHYADVFGVEFDMMMTGSEMPDFDAPRELADHIAHCSFTVNGGEIYASDDFTGSVRDMDGVSVMLTFPDAAEAGRVFDRLLDGGEVGMPFAETFWSPGFGALKDRFGTSWMISTDMPETA